MPTMADLAPLREMNEKIKKQSTFRMRFEDELDRLRKPGAYVADGVVLPEGGACYVAERRQGVVDADGKKSGMYWHVVYAHEDQMTVVHWLLAALPNPED